MRVYDQAIQLTEATQKRSSFLKGGASVQCWRAAFLSFLPLIEVHTGLDILPDTLQSTHTDGLATLSITHRRDVSWTEGRLSLNLKAWTKDEQEGMKKSVKATIMECVDWC